MQPGQQVGLMFLIMASMANGCDIWSCFFNDFQAQKFESAADFINKDFKCYCDENHQLILDIFFISTKAW